MNKLARNKLWLIVMDFLGGQVQSLLLSLLYLKMNYLDFSSRSVDITHHTIKKRHFLKSNQAIKPFLSYCLAKWGQREIWTIIFQEQTRRGPVVRG